MLMGLFSKIKPFMIASGILLFIIPQPLFAQEQVDNCKEVVLSEKESLKEANKKILTKKMIRTFGWAMNTWISSYVLGVITGNINLSNLIGCPSYAESIGTQKAAYVFTSMCALPLSGLLFLAERTPIAAAATTVYSVPDLYKLFKNEKIEDDENAEKMRTSFKNYFTRAFIINITQITIIQLLYNRHNFGTDLLYKIPLMSAVSAVDVVFSVPLYHLIGRSVSKLASLCQKACFGTK